MGRRYHFASACRAKIHYLEGTKLAALLEKELVLQILQELTANVLAQVFYEKR